jgi:hypothetical protein
MRWVDRLAGECLAAQTVPARALWLTGQSSWTNTRLSPGQEQMLDALERLGWATIHAGFPWTHRAALGPYRREPLVAASVRNTMQYLAARPGSRFAAQIAEHLQPVVDRTSCRLVILAASAGARMLAGAAPHLVLPEGLSAQVIALGPAGRLPADPWRGTAVRGRNDRISRLLYRGPVARVIDGGHLGAATSGPARAAVCQWLGAAE